MSQTSENQEPVRTYSSGGRFEVLRVLVAVALTIVVIPLAYLGAWLVYMSVVPPYSATMEVPELKTAVTLRFYYIWDVQGDQGRRLTIQAPPGNTTIKMYAFDWAHNSRTSLYLTSERELAILGPMGDDRLVSLDTLIRKNARGPSDDWTYLGAFDFADFLEPDPLSNIARRWRELRFISATEQAECIPMRGDTIYQWQVRNNARQQHDCERYVSPKVK